MTAIRKVVIELTLLLEEGERDRLMQMSLDQIADEMDEGCFIGSFSIAADAVVAASDLKPALIALGNDGSFFGDGEEWNR